MNIVLGSAFLLLTGIFYILVSGEKGNRKQKGARRIADLNEIFGEVELTEDEQRILIWLAGWDEYTIENMLSAIRKAMVAEAKRLKAARP